MDWDPGIYTDPEHTVRPWPSLQGALLLYQPEPATSQEWFRVAMLCQSLQPSQPLAARGDLFFRQFSLMVSVAQWCA